MGEGDRGGRAGVGSGWGDLQIECGETEAKRSPRPGRWRTATPSRGAGWEDPVED